MKSLRAPSGPVHYAAFIRVEWDPFAESDIEVYGPLCMGRESYARTSHSTEPVTCNRCRSILRNEGKP